MQFNRSALQYLKIKNKLKQDELFAFGNILGMWLAMEKNFKKAFPSVEQEKIYEMIDSYVTYESVCDYWDELGASFDLDIRPLPQIEEINKLIEK